MAREFKILRAEDGFIVVELNINGVKREVVYQTAPGEENILEHINKEMDIMEEVKPPLKMLIKENIGKSMEIITTQEVITDTRRTKILDIYEAKIK